MKVPALVALLALLAASEPFAPEDEARLERGETVVRLAPLPESRHSEGLAARVVPRDAERVWRAVADLDHWHEWVPFLESSERNVSAGGSPSWQLRFDLPLPLRDRHYRVMAEVGGETLSWRSIPGSGNVASARGSFTVTNRGPGRSRVIFRTATDTGDATPAFLLDRALRQSLPWVLDGLAQQVKRCRYARPRPGGCREATASTP